MSQAMRLSLPAIAIAFLWCSVCPAAETAAAPTLDERVLVLKTSLAQSQEALKTYEWVETTVVSVKGDEKSRTLQKCYYGDDGAVQRIPISAEPQDKAPRGLRGKIAERKKEELTDYMKDAIGLISLYVPPDPVRIQQCKDAGNASVSLADPGKPIRFEFKSYRVPGDLLALNVNSDSTPAALNLSTSMAKEKDTIQVDVTFGKLKDQVTYPSTIVLQAKAKDLVVSVTRTGYVKMNR